MEIISHRYLPHSMFDAYWHTAEPIHMFEELLMPRSLFVSARHLTREPRSHRVTVDISGYSPDSIKTEIKDGNKLIVFGREEIKSENDDYSIKEFRKSFDLPANAEVDKLSRFVNKNGRLIFVVPLKPKAVENNEESCVIENKDNGNKLFSMKLSLPLNIDPSKITVTCKDNDLIVNAEDSAHYYYKRLTLPGNADLNAIKCSFDGGKLLIEAPLKEQISEAKQLPVDFKND